MDAVIDFVWNNKEKITLGLIATTAVAVAAFLYSKIMPWIRSGFEKMRRAKEAALCAMNPMCVAKKGISSAASLIPNPFSAMKSKLFGAPKVAVQKFSMEEKVPGAKNLAEFTSNVPRNMAKRHLYYKKDDKPSE